MVKITIIIKRRMAYWELSGCWW